MMLRLWLAGMLLGIPLLGLAQIEDVPFLQDVCVRLEHAPQLNGALYRKLCVDRDGVPYVLTDKGVARVFEHTVALDHSFRPLSGLIAQDIALSPQGDLFYLFDDRWLSNGESGKPLGHVPPRAFTQLAVSEDGTVLLSGPAGTRLVSGDRAVAEWKLESPQLLATAGRFYAVSAGKLLQLEKDGRSTTLREEGVTTVAAFGDQLLVGTTNGFFGLEPRTGAVSIPARTRLPATHIVHFAPSRQGLWVGTTRGVFLATDLRSAATGAPGTLSMPEGAHGLRYYASKRWLRDDDVVDLAVGRDGVLWVLTRTGLNKIEFRPMTLASKAAYFDQKIRSRHMRFGLTGERRLPEAGDVSSSEIIDTDNDGGWSSYYLASQAWRYAATRDPAARRNAWDTFAALERLQSINPLPGFSARTFERAGFRFSDPDRWRAVPGGDWEWKGHTSSDEIASQSLAHAALWECAAENEGERARIAANYCRMVDHILEHNYYLVDVDGKPTLWGRWNPEYVNWYPPTVFDRRLNSAEITASLQLAYAMSGNDVYRKKAFELFEQHGYLTNILSSMRLLKPTSGYVHLGIELGGEWNHSDDELAFVTYWVLARFAFSDELRAQYRAAIQDHWDLERAEQYPMWNFIYSGCGAGAECDAAGAVWTLRGFPLETITWRIENSQRKDLTQLPSNFRGKELEELLPPGERPMSRCNTQPFILDGGDGGHTELPGDEYLFGYWLGRYLKLIGNPEQIGR